MADAPARSTGESIRLWIQAVGIPVVVAVLGLWQFWLKEVAWPSEAPVNLTTELSVKEAGFGKASARESNREDLGLEAIELQVTARNPSTRPIYLLTNIWAACGITIKPPKTKDWRGAMESQINGDHQIVGGEHYSTAYPVLVAAGNVFTDTALQPNEKIVRSFVFYVPKGAYDYVEVDVGLPTTPIERPGHPGEPTAVTEYKLRSDGSSYLPTLYRVARDGTRTDPTATDISDLGVQWALSTRMLSLWEKNSATANPPDATPLE